MLKKWRESLQQDTVLFLPRNTTKGIFPPRPTYGSVMSACLSESKLFLFEFLHFCSFRYWLKSGHAPLMLRGHLLTHQCSCLFTMCLTSIANYGNLSMDFSRHLSSPLFWKLQRSPACLFCCFSLKLLHSCPQAPF